MFHNPGTLRFRHLFYTFSEDRFLHAFWYPFGSLLAPFGSLLAPLGALLALLGALLAPLGALLAHFGSLLVDVGSLLGRFCSRRSCFF